MSTGVRENITEMLIKQKGMSSFAHMVEEGFIPGDQTLSTKKKVMEKWGFRNRYDTVRFLFDISIELTDICQSPGLLQQCYWACAAQLFTGNLL
jgi:hypothetical protein